MALLYFQLIFYQNSGAQMNKYVATIVLGLVRLAFTVVSCIMMRRCGRRPLTFVSSKPNRFSVKNQVCIKQLVKLTNQHCVIALSSAGLKILLQVLVTVSPLAPATLSSICERFVLVLPSSLLIVGYSCFTLC